MSSCKERSVKQTTLEKDFFGEAVTGRETVGVPDMGKFVAVEWCRPIFHQEFR